MRPLKKRPISPSASDAARHVRVAITMGDPAGIGPEVLAGALRRFKAARGVSFLIAGDRSLLERHGLKKRGDIAFCDFHGADVSGVRPGRPTEKSGGACLRYLREAVSRIKMGEADCLVTGPISKEQVASCGFSWPGHTEYLAEAFGVKNVEMVFVSEAFRVVLVTRHLSLKNAVRAISKDRIVSCGRLLVDVLKGSFKIRHPRIAVCGLNPHAGEGGLFGDEEKKHIAPALKNLNGELGRYFFGPFAADAVFRQASLGAFDLVMAMYHDQGLIPFKMVSFGSGVHMTAGLPFVRTSPVHGTAFDLAGKNAADAGSMAASIGLAIRLGRAAPRLRFS